MNEILVITIAVLLASNLAWIIRYYFFPQDTFSSRREDELLEQIEMYAKENKELKLENDFLKEKKITVPPHIKT